MTPFTVGPQCPTCGSTLQPCLCTDEGRARAAAIQLSLNDRVSIQQAAPVLNGSAHPDRPQQHVIRDAAGQAVATIADLAVANVAARDHSRRHGGHVSVYGPDGALVSQFLAGKRRPVTDPVRIIASARTDPSAREAALAAIVQYFGAAAIIDYVLGRYPVALQDLGESAQQWVRAMLLPQARGQRPIDQARPRTLDPDETIERGEATIEELTRGGSA